MYVARPIEWRLEKPDQPIREAGKLKFFRTICQEHKKREKERIKHVKLKVSTSDIKIKQSGLNVSNSTVPSSGELIQCRVFNKPIHYHKLVFTHWNQIYILKNEKIYILLIM